MLMVKIGLGLMVENVFQKLFLGRDLMTNDKSVVPEARMREMLI